MKKTHTKTVVNMDSILKKIQETKINMVSIVTHVRHTRCSQSRRKHSLCLTQPASLPQGWHFVLGCDLAWESLWYLRLTSLRRSRRVLSGRKCAGRGFEKDQTDCQSLCVSTLLTFRPRWALRAFPFPATRQDDVDGKYFVFYLLLELKHAIYASRQSADEKYAQWRNIWTAVNTSQ